MLIMKRNQIREVDFSHFQQRKPCFWLISGKKRRVHQQLNDGSAQRLTLADLFSR
tara:strand:+ start:11130 stop:11294 length:165 start_codon:yes stop_codon:yes gene_type:complete